MLGEINLNQWKCVAELVDNSVDGFLSSIRDGHSLNAARVHINLPTNPKGNGRVTVRDNGPGMCPGSLEKAVRAGWSGNTPINSLGMFGMGFNISTARLGTVTTVWTTRADDQEWHGLKIDFDELQTQRHFRTPHLTRPKLEPEEHGTEVTIERLKTDQMAWLSKTANVSKVRRELAKAYSSMLRPKGSPLSFNLSVNGTSIEGARHCVWDEHRSVETPGAGTVSAYQAVDTQLPNRPYCVNCWQWLQVGQTDCPSCGSSENVVERARRVHGWLGIQRYLSANDYGIDFIRNGRKIEMGNAELFYWANDDETPEKEYPIDDPRDRGRIVGEIHLDHARVVYTKDRFDRTDPAWEEMVRITRGDGPLRPAKAAQAGFAPNDSPLYALYQAFRRSTPRNAKTTGGWAQVLVVKDNDLAEDLAKRFHRGEADCQDDTKWMELVEEEDIKILGGGGGPLPRVPPGFEGPVKDADHPKEEPGTEMDDQPPPRQSPIASLSRIFVHDSTGQRWDVHALEVEEDDPELPPEAPWTMTREPSGKERFLVRSQHPVFKSITFTELDALLVQLAWTVTDFKRYQPNPPDFPIVLGQDECETWNAKNAKHGCAAGINRNVME